MSPQEQLSDIESIERLRRLTDNLPHSYLYQYSELPEGGYQFIYLSSGVYAIHGVTPEEIMADANLLLGSVDPELIPELQRQKDESRQSLTDFRVELRVRHQDGHWFWLELRSRPRRTESGIVMWDGVATDITKKHEQQLQLRHQAGRAEILLELPQLEEKHPEQEFLQEVLKRLAKLTGSSVACLHLVNDEQNALELIAWTGNDAGNLPAFCIDGKTPLSQAGIWADAVRQARPFIMNDCAASHSPLQRLLCIPVLEHGEVLMLASLANKKSDFTPLDSETLQLIGNEVWRIITKRRVEKALRIASQVVNASPVVCFRWRAETNWPVEFVSDNITQWGYTPEEMLAGTPTFAQMIHPEDLARVVDEVTGYTANGLATYLQEYRLIKRNGEIIWIEDRTIVRRDGAGKVLFYDGVLTDMSDRRLRQETMDQTLLAQRQLNKRLEEAHNQLLQSEKMASIGQLAAGIAHELNNPIGFVHSNMGTLEGYLRDLMDLIDCYDSALAGLSEDAPQRIKIGQLKEERDYSYVREDIFNLLGESKDGLNRVRKIVQDLKSFSHVGEQEWQPADLHQGLDSTLNIVWNELKYKCTIRKEYAELPKVYCLISQLNQVFMNLLVNAGQAIESKGEITIRSSMPDAENVQIEICDSGKGIEAAHLNRIFEPFFTTKPVGKGTGLGLSLSYNIIERHHGRIEVSSEVGKGTCFRVIIPVRQPKADKEAAATEIST